MKESKSRMWANAQRLAVLPNIGGALSSTPQSFADAQYRAPCSSIGRQTAGFNGFRC